MKKYLFSLLALVVIAFTFFSCSNNKNEFGKRVIIAIPADVTTFNPMFAVNAVEGNISELIYLGLAELKWNQEKNDLEYDPSLAKSWEWSPDSLSLTVLLRDDVYWSDGVQFNADDVVFTYDICSDAKAQSKFFGMFKNFIVREDLSIDIGKSFEILSPYKIKINFNKKSVPTLFDIGYPILPKHIFEKIARTGLANAEQNLKPIGTGPYKLLSWEKNQSIKLVRNEKSILFSKSVIPELIFKIVPDYNARINQLKSGEVDFTEDIKPVDVEDLNKNEKFKIDFQKGRVYDYVGWNNIDPGIFNKNKKVTPNKLFGNPTVRKALTYAIDSKTILEEFLSNYGEVAVGPIAPIFRNSVDESLKAYPFDPSKAKEMLAQEGWVDSNLNGTIDKNGKEFTFTLFIPGGNPLRSSTATMVKNNLKSIGIDVTVETVEPQVFWGSVYAKKYDAWIAGWSVPIPINLKPYWYSDLKNNPPNLISYQNPEADKLLEKMETKISKEELNQTHKKFLSILYKDVPVTFLFWKNKIVVYNKKINGVAASPLGVLHKCWNWSISE